jgi:hypothetical protein
MSRRQIADHMAITSKSLETVASFMYFGRTVTNQNYIREDMKGKVKG